MRRIHLYALIALAVLAGAAYLHQRPSPETIESESHWNADNSTRLAIWRPYGREHAPMTLCTGKDACKTIDGVAPVATADQPYYLTVSDASQLHISPEPSRIEYLDPNPAALTPGRYESGHPALRYAGHWVWQHREGPTDGQVHTALDPTSAVSFEFEGSGVEIGMVFYDDRRTSRLCIDSVCRDIALFSHSLEWQQPILIYGLKPGKHTASLQLVAGKAMDIDWVRVLGTPEPLTVGEVLPTDERLSTTSNWQGTTTTALTASAAFTFTGKGAELRFPTSTDSGEVMICVNGHCRVEDLFAWQAGERTVKFDAPQGTHHVVIQKGPSRRMDLPHITIN